MTLYKVTFNQDNFINELNLFNDELNIDMNNYIEKRGYALTKKRDFIIDIDFIKTHNNISTHNNGDFIYKYLYDEIFIKLRNLKIEELL